MWLALSPWFCAGYYFTGDGAYRTESGYYQITGRMDDVINISGHRLGTAEIEDAIVSSGHAFSAVLAAPRCLGGGWDSVPWVCPVLWCSLTCSVCAQAEHPAVPETAVVSFPHDIKGEGESQGGVVLIIHASWEKGTDRPQRAGLVQGALAGGDVPSSTRRPQFHCPSGTLSCKLP